MLLHGPDEAVAGMTKHDDHGPDRLALAGSVIMPNRPKSASATSPGGVSAIRTVVLLGLCRLRFTMKRRSDG